ncbi:hypothetical protein Esti_004555 [Eimeria stiedai]
MSVAEVPGSTLPVPSSSLQAATGKGSLTRGRGCKIGRGLPLQQRKAYRNLARQTPRVQGLTFDHNQIRWISYWKNEQNKQVQKHFPVSRYGFLGARRLALEERNRIMGRPPDADEAAEAIANLKVDPSIPCFLEWNSPSQHEEVQAVEVEDEATCTSAETWQDEEGDSATEARRSETVDVTGPAETNGAVCELLPPGFSSEHLRPMHVQAPHTSAMNAPLADFHGATSSAHSADFIESADVLEPSSFPSVGSSRRAGGHHAALRVGGKQSSAAAAADVFPRSCKVDEVTDDCLSRAMTRTTTAAQDACTERAFLPTDLTTSSTSACFEETDMQPDGGLAPLTPLSEHKTASPEADYAETFKRPAPPALSLLAIAWDDKATGGEISADTGPMSLFCTTDGERRAACSSPSALIQGPRRVGFNDFEAAGHPIYDAFIGGGYFSPRAASSEGGSLTQGLSRASTMREVFDFWDSRKSLCTTLIRDLFQSIRRSDMLSPTNASASSTAGVIPADVRGRDLLEREEAMHCFAIEEAKGFEQLEPYLETFRHCLVASLMPSQLPRGEMVSMVWTLRYRLLLPWGKSAIQRNFEQQFGAPPQNISPFRERHGMTHRLLTDGVQAGAHITLDLSAASAIGLGSPTAEVGRTSGFVPPPSLFFGPAHAPSSPTAALYGGCFSNATEQDHQSAAL